MIIKYMRNLKQVLILWKKGKTMGEHKNKPSYRLSVYIIM